MSEPEHTYITRMSRARVEELGNQMAEFGESMKFNGSYECLADYQQASARYLFAAKVMEDQGVAFIQNESLLKLLSFEPQSTWQMTGAAMVKPTVEPMAEPTTKKKLRHKLAGWLRGKS